MAAILASALHDDADFKSATDLYRELEYEQAMLTFERLSVSSAFTVPERAEVLLWSALCADGLGDSPGSDRWMKEALARDATAQFPVKAPPRISQRLEELRAEVAAQASAANDVKPADVSATVAKPIDLVPIALGVGSVVTLVGTGVLAYVAADQYGKSRNAALYVDERITYHGLYVGALAGTIAAGVVGAGLGAAAGTLAIIRSEP